VSSFQWFFAGVAFGAWLVAMATAGMTWLANRDAAPRDDEGDSRDERFRQIHDRSDDAPPPPPPENVIPMRARRDDS